MDCLLLIRPVLRREDSLQKSILAQVAALQRVPPQRPAILAGFEAIACHDHAHLFGQACEPVVKIFFRDLALCLLLVAVGRRASKSVGQWW